jgi:AcrR family transcriptional regulator
MVETAGRRTQILEVARQLFSERSFAEVSSEEIAAAAGIRRGLLHYYFGSKRDLYLEVVRSLLADAAMPFERRPDDTMEDAIALNVGLFLDRVGRDAEAWLAIQGTVGFGRDLELEHLVVAARDATVERIIGVLGLTSTTHLRAVLRCYAAFAESTLDEWLRLGSVSRPQVESLLAATLLALIHHAAPEEDADAHADSRRVSG